MPAKKNASKTKAVKRKVSPKTVSKNTGPSKTKKNIKSPKIVRVQTAEGWKRSMSAKDKVK